ncbi:hypothetical protein HGQ85_15900 [Clostridioides difficile]|nr:hypothetical protein [Clostridioides difficile]
MNNSLTSNNKDIKNLILIYDNTILDVVNKLKIHKHYAKHSYRISKRIKKQNVLDLFSIFDSYGSNIKIF